MEPGWLAPFHQQGRRSQVSRCRSGQIKPRGPLRHQDHLAPDRLSPDLLFIADHEQRSPDRAPRAEMGRFPEVPAVLEGGAPHILAGRGSPQGPERLGQIG